MLDGNTTKPLVPDPSPFKVETATANLKKYTVSGSDQIKFWKNSS
jgi:hypothetical protein